MSVRVILRLLKSKYILIEDTQAKLKKSYREHFLNKILVLDTDFTHFQS
jgi:hypothetical protein